VVFHHEATDGWVVCGGEGEGESESEVMKSETIAFWEGLK